MTGSPLAGKSVLVTRPEQQSARISQMIREAGGQPFVFPCIEIQAPTNPQKLEELLDRLTSFGLAIFVSPTAVTRAFERLAGRAWPESLKVAAVGQGSALALRERGRDKVIAPVERADSEALLSLPALQSVAGMRIVIFRGEGGRELMAQTLVERGAAVEYAECYRRGAPNADVVPLLQQQRRQPFSAMLLTSRESLSNLHEMLGDDWNLFASVPAFVPHARIAEAARQLGLKSVHVTSDGDAGTIQAMVKFFRS